MAAQNKDMTVPCGDGLINIRAGAIIAKDGKILMVGNDNADHLYSVGGRVKFGETAEEAIRREVFEETGVKMEIDRLGFVHENCFYGDSAANKGKLIYEISFYFYMKIPDDFSPVCTSCTDFDGKEHLEWVTPDTETTIYPEFFREYALSPADGVRHMVTDER